MTRKSVAGLLAAASLGVFAPEAPAQTIGDAVAPTFFTYDGGQEFRNNAGDSVGVLYGISNQPDVNVHTFSGDLGGRTVTGVAYLHTYDRARNHGTYLVSSGLLLGQMTVQYDRLGRSYEITLAGTMAGQPIDFTTGRIAAG